MTVLDDINDERERQIVKGFDALHDAQHSNGEILRACTGVIGSVDGGSQRDQWGIAAKWEGDDRRKLVIAAALIVAEIERRDRLSESEEERATFTFGYLMRSVPNWDAFCDDVGLDPWCVNEGKADSSDTFSAPLSILRKHGVLS